MPQYRLFWEYGLVDVTQMSVSANQKLTNFDNPSQAFGSTSKPDTQNSGKAELSINNPRYTHNSRALTITINQITQDDDQ